MRRIEAQGALITIDEEGEGPPVLLVHGALGDRRLWSAVRAALPGPRRTIAVTQSGYGPEASPEAVAALSRTRHPRELIALIEALDCGPVHVVGWSYGGEMSVYAMAARPDLFRSAVLFEPAVTALLDEAAEPDRSVLLDFKKRMAGAAAAVAAGDLERAAALFLGVTFASPGGEEESPALTPRPEWMLDNARTLPVFLKQTPGRAFEPGELEGIDLPVRVQLGARSHERYRLMAERLVERLPQGRLEVVANVGHGGPIERPDAIAAAMAEHLRAGA